jgi:urease accessory protein
MLRLEVPRSVPAFGAACAVALLLAPTAHAHPGDLVPSLAGGASHPLLGLDHLLAMVAVGLWAGQVGGRARWALPLSFVAVMVLGGGLAMSGVALPAVEAGIGVSVLLLGLLVAAAARWPLALAAPLVALFALLHGHAHGTEVPPNASGAAYAAGFAVATAALHLLGLALSLLAARVHVQGLVRAAGVAIAVAGVLLVA